MTVPLWLLFLMPLLLGLGTQRLLQWVFSRDRTVANHARASGAATRGR